EMNQKEITTMFFSDPKYAFEYSTSTGWSSMWMPQGQYDFYLMLAARYCDEAEHCEEDGGVNYAQFGNFIGRARGVSVQKSDDNPNLGTAAQPIPVNILGSIGTGVATGRVSGERFFTARDFDKLFANFDSEIEALIPAVMLYDTSGDLRAFTHAMPDEHAISGFMEGVISQDPEVITSTLAAHPLVYYVWGLPPGRYTAVFAQPNYPPLAKEITLPDDAVYNMDFDAQNVLVGSISGVVRSSATGAALGGARVYLDHRTVEKFTLTDPSGAFSFTNLPAGIYRMEVSREGYVTTGVKTGMSGEDTLSFDVYMSTSSSKITGKVYLSKFPTAVTKAGVKVVAYDESENTGYLPDGTPLGYTAAYLPKTEIKTEDDGTFQIPGVIPGHLYKVSAFYSGKLPESMSVTAEEGNTIMQDITMKDIPPQISIRVKKSADSSSKVDVRIKSPKTLISIPTCRYNPGQVFDSTAAVSLTLAPAPGNTYVGQFTLSRSQQYYTVKVQAGDGGNRMEKEFVYDQVSNAKTEQYIQQESLAGGEVQMDKESEEYSGIELDPGAITYTTTTASDFSNLVGGFFSALPSVRTVKTGKGDLSISDALQGLMASEVYNMDLSNAQPNKPFTLTLKYDKERATSSGALKIYQQDANGNWNEVPGNYTVDPMSGVVSVDVPSLDLAYEGTGSVNTPLGRKRYGMSSVSNGRYVPSSTSSSQSGRFAVFTAKPGTGVAYTGSAFKVYNMPNPFDLNSKNVSLSGDVGASGLSNPYPTTGTLLKYHLPAGKTGAVKFVIYNAAGEKVRTIEEGVRTGGEIFYSEWDGRNDAGRKCASGVYFLMTFLDGEALDRKAHKMALIK
ncbi:MAG: carboxypeptidase regulatory-like domain-containing protein, partial [Elusimicrobiales bacterium]|nr:carboxypeptidase regulatory-like domain-containing protein [Elusimicrobiales bacterium]